MSKSKNNSWKDFDINDFKLSNLNFDFISFINRNIILVILSILFIITNSLLYSYIYDYKYDLIIDLEDEQKIVNEKFITAQILSEKLNNVYNVFEQNLASDNNDPKNKEANMMFLKDLTDVLEKLDIKLLQIEPGGKKKIGFSILSLLLIISYGVYSSKSLGV